MLRSLQRLVRAVARLGPLLGAAVATFGCGQVGPPLPPSPNLAALATDLRAERLGPTLELSWAAPLHNADGSKPHGAMTLEVCAWPPGAPLHPDSPCPLVLARRHGESLASLPAGMDLPLSEIRQGVAGDHAVVAVRYVNDRDRSLGWSPFLVVPLTPAAPIPRDVTATLVPEGVQLTWHEVGAEPGDTVRIYRRVASSGAASGAAGLVLLAEVPATSPSFLDRTVERNQGYVYALRSSRTVSGARPAGVPAEVVESAETPALSVVYRDIFPPAVPSGLQVLHLPGGSPGVDLTWDAVTAADLAGYNVYRRTGAGWEKRNTALLLTPVFHDPETPAQGSAFAVTAVDASGNESARSPVVLVTP